MARVCKPVMKAGLGVVGSCEPCKLWTTAETQMLKIKIATISARVNELWGGACEGFGREVHMSKVDTIQVSPCSVGVCLCQFVKRPELFYLYSIINLLFLKFKQ